MDEFKTFYRHHARIKYLISLLVGIEEGDRDLRHFENYNQIRRIFLFRNWLEARCTIPAMKKSRETKKLGETARARYAKIYRMVDAMYEVDPDCDDFQYMIGKFQSAFDEFADFIENQWLPEVRKIFTAENYQRLETVAEDLETPFKKRDYMAQIERETAKPGVDSVI